MRKVLGMAGIAMLAGFAGAGVSGAAAQDGNFAYIGASLFGEYEIGHEGAGEDASADFSAELDLTNGRICYLLEATGLDDFTTAHLHEGTKERNGAPVITLQLVGEDGDDVCVDADVELLKRIARAPERYYVNVHTARFPEGAVRGQLGE